MYVQEQVQCAVRGQSGIYIDMDIDIHDTSIQERANRVNMDV